MTARRRPLRLRLTLLYAGAVAASGAVLVAVTYALVAATIADQPLDTVQLALRGDASSVLIDLSDADVRAGGGTGADGGADAGATGVDGDEPVLTLAEVADAVAAVNAGVRADTLGALLGWSLLTLGVAVALAGALGWVVASRALAPLHRITATARRVADDSLHRRIALAGPRDEIRDLADTFDAMLERLDRSFDGQRRFVALASHELRTPLTITRTVLEVALDDPAAPAETRALGERLLGVNARHERLIDGLLTLAVAEQAPTTAERADLADLADLARTVVAQAAGEAERAGVRVDLDLGAAPVTGDPLLLERLVQNLVDNAVRHNAPGGFVTVRTGPARGGAGVGGGAGAGDGAAPGGVAEVVVENSGPVVPPDAVPALTEPFHQHAGGPGADVARRRRRARNGSAGLGLSIVAAVATAHGGALHLAPRPAGGLRATVTLPA